MTHYHVCVWIDHREARIFGVGLEETDSEVAANVHAAHHIHRKANQVGLGTDVLDHGFLAEVAALLEPAKAILIAGPGKAKTELASYLNEHLPDVAKNVWGVEAMDHPSDGQLVAAARTYFKAADRMHS
ncbi:MAG: translational machinery protein [Devosia sp.]|nr:translational machinery protein [Devosia sp.]